jgi:hypothetical protein
MTWQMNPDDLVERAGQVVDDLLMTHQPAPWPDDLNHAIQKIVEKML